MPSNEIIFLVYFFLLYMVWILTFLSSQNGNCSFIRDHRKSAVFKSIAHLDTSLQVDWHLVALAQLDSTSLQMHQKIALNVGKELQLHHLERRLKATAPVSWEPF